MAVAQAQHAVRDLSNVLEAQLALNPMVSDGMPVASGTALSGQLTGNTVLVANGIYTVPANLEIVSGTKLTIAPGVKIAERVPL